MFDPTMINDELQALKTDLARLVASTAGEALDETRRQADALGHQIRSMLGDIAETLSDEESQVAKLIAERPVTSVASAFALGLLVGMLMRRH